MGSQNVPLHLTFSDFERSSSIPIKYHTLVSQKSVELGHMLLMNTTR